MPRATRYLIPILVLAAAAAARTAPPQEAGGTVYRVPVTGVIELGLAPFVERSIREAESAGARALILDMDTPGGRVDAAQRIADALGDAGIPTYAFVNRRAFSAGALISLATDGIYMRPGSVIGAATPVSGSGEKAPEKIVSAMRSEMRALAEARGLDPRIAEAMVDEEIAVEGISEAGKLLTLTTEEAVSVGFAAEVEDLPALLGEIGTPDARVTTMEVNWAERIVRILTHPVVSPFLLTLGFLGLLVEIKTPTFGMAGLAGLLSIGLFFGSHLIIGLAGWEDIILFGVGAILMAVEALVVPGFGIFGVTGIVALLAAIYLALIGNLPTMPDLTQAAGVVSATILMVLVSTWALLRYLPQSRRLAESGILLATDEGSDIGYASAVRRDDLMGAVGEALTDLRPAGTGRFGDERVDVVSEGGWIEAGERIRIIASEGYRHVVRSVETSENRSTEDKD